MSKEIDSNYYIPKSSKSIVLVSGPASSGKSKWAEYLLKDHLDVCYIATGLNTDHSEQWLNRINIHKERRPKHWTTIESSKDLSEKIKIYSHNNILIDSLGGFVASYLDLDDIEWQEVSLKFKDIIFNTRNISIIVIEETGWGVVPETFIGNKFRDRLGYLSQQLDVISDASWLVIQGRALDLKKIGLSVPQ